MATSTELATRALRRLSIIGAGETPSPADVDVTTEALDEMIDSWEASGLSGDILPLDSRFERGLVAMLAVRIADEFGKTPSPMTVQDADDGWRAIQGAYFSVPATQFENAIAESTLSPTEIILGQETGNYTAWQASTAYGLRQYAINGANVYECTTAGTSAASGGPTGTGTEITDGTVVWCFRRVDAWDGDNSA